MAEAMEQRAPPIGRAPGRVTRRAGGRQVVAEPDRWRPARTAPTSCPGAAWSRSYRHDHPRGPRPGGGPSVCPECGEVDDAAREVVRLVRRASCAPPRPARDAPHADDHLRRRADPVGRGPAPGAETLRAARWSYFEVMRGILERHGATVEKYIGDAIMAVFGLPRRTEDDALRAVKAAAQMQAALAGRQRDPAPRVRPGHRAADRRQHGQRDRGRRGPRPAAGHRRRGQRRRPVRAGGLRRARCCWASPPCALVRNSVEIEPLEPLELRGKAAFVRAFRLMKVGADATRVGAPRGADGRPRRGARALAEVYGRAAGDGEPHDGHDPRRRRRRQEPARRRVHRRSPPARARGCCGGAASPTARASRSCRWWRSCARRRASAATTRGGGARQAPTPRRVGSRRTWPSGWRR